MNQQYLKECLDYNPETGIFMWKARPLHHFKAPRQAQCKAKLDRLAGTCAGVFHPQGYMQVKIGSKTYKLHRLAFLYMTGELPPEDVDHRNGIPADNRWKNLREASTTINSRNQRRRVNNSSGLHGVHWCKRKKKWVAQISLEPGRRTWLGVFSSPEDARRAREAAEVGHGYSQRHGRV